MNKLSNLFGVPTALVLVYRSLVGIPTDLENSGYFVDWSFLSVLFALFAVFGGYFRYFLFQVYS